MVIGPAPRAGDPGSNPGPGENFSLMYIYIYIYIYLCLFRKLFKVYNNVVLWYIMLYQSTSHPRGQADLNLCNNMPDWFNLPWRIQNCYPVNGIAIQQGSE